MYRDISDFEILFSYCGRMNKAKVIVKYDKNKS